ncbi:hypothetical protein [Rubrivivax benzoatilyticus]|nr:hypothetical protein [Rubrivivax benzoatilyticus]
MLKKTMAIAVLAAALTGCATIMGSPTQTLPIGSTPSDADIMITDESGVQVFAGKTPTSVTLNKSTGRYWGGKKFTVTISKPGYKTQVIPVAAGANGWYIAGNLIFGGLIGWFVVDPLSGNMYTLSPESVASSLPADPTAHNNKTSDGSISIVLLQDVPASLRENLVRVN